jgi:PAS domain S-box-containing protein
MSEPTDATPRLRSGRAWHTLGAWPAVGTVLLSALVAIALLQWRHLDARTRLRQAASAIDNAAQARLHVTRAYLVARSADAGDASFSRADADAALERAGLAVEDWLAGRSAPLGWSRAPLRDAETRRLVAAYGADVRAFRALLARPAARANAVDVRTAYAALEARGDSIADRAAALLARGAREDSARHAATIFLFALCVCLIGAWLWRLAGAARHIALRSERFQALTAALAAARTPNDVAAAVAEHALRAIGAALGTVGLLVEEGRQLEVVAAVGYGEELAPWRRFPNAGALPAVEAVASGAPVFVERRAELLARYPALAEVAAASGFCSTAVIPLLSGARGGRALGYLAFDFRRDRDFPAEDRRFLATLGELCAQAMDRALSYVAEREARAEAQAERERLALVLDRLPVGVLVVRGDGAVVQHNRALEATIRHPVYAAESIGDYGAFGGVHADGRPFAPEEYPVARALLRGEVIERELMRYRRGDGSEALLSISAAPVPAPDGGPPYVVAGLLDVTPLHEAERALRESEARFRHMTERLPLGVFQSDAEGRVTYCNPRLCELLGADEAELLRDGWLDRVHPEDVARLVAERAAFRASGAAAGHFDYRVWHGGSGEVRHLVMDLATVRDARGAVESSVGVVEDVTEQRALEAQFRQAQKMEAVGRLAGGVAHDFNNLLTVILAMADLLLADLPGADPRHGDVAEIRDAGQRAAELTRQLLAFSRRQLIQPRAFDLNALARRAEKLLRRLIGEDVALALALDDALPLAYGDPGQVEQALVNLAVNARDAMPEGGTLTIATERVTLDARDAAAHPDAPAGEFATLVVRDTGTGMDAETQARVFEPFFTTKEPGQGTGLGLSMVYGVAAQMGGHVTVESAPGLGSTFRLFIPVAASPAADAPAAAAPRAEPGGETVLVVEDDAALRRTVHRMLEEAGYAVLAASGAEEAVAIAGAHAGPIDLLLTDVVMPGQGGRACADAVAAARPGIVVAFMSGYTADVVLRQRLREGEPFLEKPFTIAQLTRFVRHALDQRRRPPR